MIPDRIEAGTYLALAAAVGDGVHVTNVIHEHLESFLSKLEEMGVNMDVREDSIFVHPVDKLKPVNIKTYPYPGFATDLQQPITPLLLKAEGESVIEDTIYQQRVNHIPELARMGGRCHVEGNMIISDGQSVLKGAEVAATDYEQVPV